MIIQNLTKLLPIVFLPMCNAAKAHWHHAIAEMCMTILSMLMDADKKLFTECALAMKDENVL
jgi:hypothetical protein